MESIRPMTILAVWCLARVLDLAEVIHSDLGWAL